MNNTEEAQARVARAQGEKDRIDNEIKSKHGSLKDLDRACNNRDKEAKELRMQRARIMKELHLAKQDLKLERETAPDAAHEDQPTYDELLAQYKDLCREIEGLGCSYGSPSAEEKKLKKERLELRKTLRSMAPLKTCWFCGDFSINNYDSPCREGALGRGDVPKEACDCWAPGHHYVDEGCLVAWPEFQAMKEAEKAKETVIEIPPNASPELVEQQLEKVAEAAEVREEDQICDHGVPLSEECRECNENHPENVSVEDWGMFHGTKTEVADVPEEECKGEPVVREPFWKGGPLDTVNGMPWHTAFAEASAGDLIVLEPGHYSWKEDNVVDAVDLEKPMRFEISVLGVWTPTNVMNMIDRAQANDERELPEQPAGEPQPYGQQMKFDHESGGLVPAPMATVLHKPRAVPVEIKLSNNQFKLNTTEEGLENAAEKPRDDIRAWVIPRLKVLKDATIRQGDFDKAADLMVKIILGEVEVDEQFGSTAKQASPAAKGEA